MPGISSPNRKSSVFPFVPSRPESQLFYVPSVSISRRFREHESPRLLILGLLPGLRIARHPRGVPDVDEILMGSRDVVAPAAAVRGSTNEMVIISVSGMSTWDIYTAI